MRVDQHIFKHLPREGMATNRTQTGGRLMNECPFMLDLDLLLIHENAGVISAACLNCQSAS